MIASAHPLQSPFRRLFARRWLLAGLLAVAVLAVLGAAAGGPAPAHAAPLDVYCTGGQLHVADAASQQALASLSLERASQMLEHSRRPLGNGLFVVRSQDTLTVISEANADQHHLSLRLCLNGQSGVVPQADTRLYL